MTLLVRSSLRPVPIAWVSALAALLLSACGGRATTGEGVPTSSAAGPPSVAPPTVTPSATCADPGAVWALVLPFSSPYSVPTRARIWGSGPNDVYVTGLGLKLGHFDGTSWSPVAAAPGAFSITGGGPSDVYVADGDGVLFRFDGASWQPVGDAFNYIPPIWGSRQAGVFGPELDQIAQWSPQGWRVNPLGFSAEALSGTSADDVFAVGSGVAHGGAHGWTEIATDTATGAALRDVCSVGAGLAFAVGDKGLVARVTPTALAVLVPTDAGLPDRTGVWGMSANDVYVVGGTRAEHFDGSAWTSVAVPVDGALLAVWGSGPGDVYIAAQEGLLHCAR
jgi:hypothetical protein